MNFSVCCIKGCNAKSLALGLCANHWRRNKKYGSPVASKNHAGQYRGLSPEERFWPRVKKQLSGCWEWGGAKDQDGYGVFRGEVGGVKFNRAHRFSYAVHFGEIPEGSYICHSCDNPKCVNPEHLWAGTPRDNMEDRDAKGRRIVNFGESCTSSKITKDQAAAILIDPRPYVVIAEEYNIAASTVGSIKNRESWASIEGEAVKPKRESPRKGVSDKFTPEDIISIRASKERNITLAGKYGVSQQTICDIRKMRSWTHVKTKENGHGC